MKLKAKIERIFFKKEGFSSALCYILTPLKGVKFEEQPVPSSMVFSGNYFPRKLGEELMFSGDFVNDAKYGLQFKVIASMPPLDNSDSIEAYLSSSFVKGIGKKLAQRIVQTFGSKSIEKLKQGGDDVLAIKGITPAKLEDIQNSINASTIYMDIIEFFNGLASVSQVEKIYLKYGNDAIKKLKKNPYCLITDIQGFAFKTVDALAQKANIPKNSPQRVEAAIVFTLQNLANSGHCFCDINCIYTEVNNLFNDLEVSEDTFAECIGNLIMQKKVYLDDNRLYWEELYKAETFVAKKTKELLATTPNEISYMQILNVLAKYESKIGFTLEEQQKNAIVMAVNNCISCITGGAGTGKSTIIKGIISVITEYTKHKIILAAPTGKASRRMAEVTELPASTIHKIVAENGGTPIENAFIILDEMSMTDILLAKDIFSLVGKNSQIVLIGDVNQLAPVGAGSVFKDLLACKLVPKTALDVSHRCTGSIALNADKINNGVNCNNWVYDNQFLLYKSGKEDLQKDVVGMYLALAKKYDIKDIQLIVPMKARGTTAANVLNEIIRSHLNPAPTGSSEGKFRVGDRVMITKNNSRLDINNGDSGTITDIDVDDNITFVVLDDGREVELDAETAKNMQLAYAITCHKAQGQEYKCVVLAQSSEHYIMLQRNLLYTAVTRAKEKLVLVGETKSINLALRNTKQTKRETYLLQRLYLNNK